MKNNKEVRNMKAMKWQEPKLIAMNRTAHGADALCYPGTSATQNCFPGLAASTWCFDGGGDS